MFDNNIGGLEIVVCLYDKKYHYGVAALANSLSKSGFKGIIYIGYTDNLPPWTNQLQTNNNEYILTKHITLKFEYIQPNMHLAFYKPCFIKNSISKFPLANKIFYFDVDIVVNAPWSFFSNWVSNNVCLCLDNSYDFVDFNHPWREDWKRLADIKDVDCRKITAYVNSGFVGIARNNTLVIDKWIELTESFVKWGGNINEIDQRGYNSYKGDQDLLNATLTVLPEIQLSIIGREGMGFKQPAYLMSHSIAKKKPWSKNFLRYLIKTGQKPTFDEKNFFYNCRQPIKLFSKTEFFFRYTNLRLSAFLGRYIGY